MHQRLGTQTALPYNLRVGLGSSAHLCGPIIRCVVCAPQGVCLLRCWHGVGVGVYAALPFVAM